MRKPSLIKNYSKLSDNNLDLKGKEIIAALTNNANFPATSPTVAELIEMSAVFSAALLVAIGGERSAIAQKRKAREDLLKMLNLLALDIEALAQHDRSKLATSGFELGSEGGVSTELTGPENFKLTDGPNAGQLRSTVKSVPGALMYSHEYTLDQPRPDSMWVPTMTSTIECILSGLPSGRRIYCRVGAAGRKKQMVYTEVISRVVQ